MTVTWADASDNETGFRIQRSLSPAFAAFSEFTVAANATSFIDTGLLANTTYYYRVESFNAAGSHGFTTIFSEATLPAPTGNTGPLTAPAGLAGVVGRNNTLLSWNDNSGNEDGWEIQISTVYNFTAATTRTVTVSQIDAESFNVDGLNTYTWYYFRVRAVNSTNVSPWTGSIKLKTTR
jgi:hypothetical protein